MLALHSLVSGVTNSLLNRITVFNYSRKRFLNFLGAIYSCKQDTFLSLTYIINIFPITVLSLENPQNRSICIRFLKAAVLKGPRGGGVTNQPSGL